MFRFCQETINDELLHVSHEGWIEMLDKLFTGPRVLQKALPSIQLAEQIDHDEDERVMRQIEVCHSLKLLI